MTINPISGSAPGLPSADLDLYAGDELVAARDLILLIELGSRGLGNDDKAAITAGCHAALARLSNAEQALRGLRQSRREAA